MYQYNPTDTTSNGIIYPSNGTAYSSNSGFCTGNFITANVQNKPFIKTF